MEEIDDTVRDRLKEYKTLNDWKKKPEKGIQSWGDVLNAFEIAFWTLATTTSFEAVPSW
jgi:hypothetical protein